LGYSQASLRDSFAMRLIYMGTPELARTVLQRLLTSADLKIMAVVTQPDRPKGRDLRLTPSPVKQLAVEAGLPVLQPQRARDPGFISQIRDLQPDLIAVAAYGQILPKSLLEVPPSGCLNVHTSLLPRYRGAAPIQWAILNGDPETGVTIMKMDEGMDTGAIVAVEKTPITESDNSQTLHDRLATLGADLLVRTIPAYASGTISPRPQPPEGVVLAPKIKKVDGEIDWHQPARAIWNRVRALVPWPGAYTYLPTDPRSVLKIWRVEPSDQSGPAGRILEGGKAGILVGCGDGCVRILEVQRENARRLSAAQFLAGHPLEPGMRLGRDLL
jgi:methionyl-tRNA formyltransferase